jgi:hypothetical protein
MKKHKDKVKSFKIELLKEDGNRLLYQCMVYQFLDVHPVNKHINQEWKHNMEVKISATIMHVQLHYRLEI